MEQIKWTRDTAFTQNIQWKFSHCAPQWAVHSSSFSHDLLMVRPGPFRSQDFLNLEVHRQTLTALFEIITTMPPTWHKNQRDWKLKLQWHMQSCISGQWCIIGQWITVVLFHHNYLLHTWKGNLKATKVARLRAGSQRTIWGHFPNKYNRLQLPSSTRVV